MYKGWNYVLTKAERVCLKWTLKWARQPEPTWSHQIWPLVSAQDCFECKYWPKGDRVCFFYCPWPCQRISRWHLNSGVQSTRKEATDGWISDRQNLKGFDFRMSLFTSCAFAWLSFFSGIGMVWVGVGDLHGL